MVQEQYVPCLGILTQFEFIYPIPLIDQVLHPPIPHTVLSIGEQYNLGSHPIPLGLSDYSINVAIGGIGVFHSLHLIDTTTMATGFHIHCHRLLLYPKILTTC
jgi:hypothetical protein